MSIKIERPNEKENKMKKIITVYGNYTKNCTTRVRATESNGAWVIRKRAYRDAAKRLRIIDGDYLRSTDGIDIFTAEELGWK